MDLKNQIHPTISLLTAISVIGGIGNLFVILIYIRRCDKITSNLFMTVLAGSDIFTCIFIIPTTIFIEFNDWNINNFVVCKSYMFFNNCVIPFSALLISLIALDRYFCICHPFLQLMNLQRSKIFICVVLFISILLGILASFQVHIEIRTENSTGYGAVNVSKCVEADNWQEKSFSQRLFYEITQKSQLVSYSICILIVIVLYSAIYCTVIKVRRKKDQLKGNTQYRKAHRCKFDIPTSYKPYPHSHGELSQVSPINTRHGATTNLQVSEQRIRLSPNFSTNHNPSNSLTHSSYDSINPNLSASKRLRNIRETKFIQNFKLAAMLFVVAITYIVTFLPANMMANKVIELYLPVFYMYYINNAANPIIYCFMNRNFRNELKSLRFLRPLKRK